MIGMFSRLGAGAMMSRRRATAAPYSWADLQAEPGATFALHSQAGITGDPAVTAWAEQWQGANLVTGNSPTYGATSLDGKPGVTFDGTADYLLDTTITLAAGDKTVYIVQDLTTVTAAARLLAAFTNTGTGTVYFYQHDASGNVAIYDGVIRSAGVAATTGPQIMRYTLDSGGAAGSSTVHRDGVQIATLTCSALGASNGVHISRSPGLGIQFAAATLGGIFVFDALHTAQEAARVEAFLGATFLDA